VETAIGVAALVVVVALCAAAVAAAMAELRCLDAAREAARLAARGDDAAQHAAAELAPAGATVTLHTEPGCGEGCVIAEVVAHAPLLPTLRLHGRAVAAREP
jgi:hypothetical protein